MQCLRLLLKSSIFFLLFAGKIATAKDPEIKFPTHENNSAFLLDMDTQAFLARFELLDKDQPFLSTYQLYDDRIGLGVMAKLLDAAKEGRKPRLLLDWMETNIPIEVIHYLIENGVEVRQYRRGHDLSNLWNNGVIGGINRRMHSKILTTGDNHMITGGRNWSDSYFGLSGQERNIDLDVLVQGDVVNDARAYQEFLWDSKYVQKITTPKRTPELDLEYEKIKSRIEANYADLMENGLIPDKNKGWIAKYLRPVKEISFVWDHEMIKGKPKGSGDAIVKLIREAKTEILIETQYLLPVSDILKELKKAADRGVKIKIITNGPDSKAHEFSSKLTVAAQEINRKRLQHKGIEILEVNDHWLHSKQVVVDGTKSLVWSHNMDPRSWNINLEAGVQINDLRFGEHLKSRIESHIMINPTSMRNGVKIRADKCVHWFKAMILSIPTVQNNL